MSRAHVREFPSAGVASSSGQNASPRVLAIGDVDEWQEQGYPLPQNADMAFRSFHDIGEALLNELDPDVIYSPVLARSFDCIELALLLETLRYQGLYRAVAKDLPKPALIEREVRQLCTRLKFELAVSID